MARISERLARDDPEQFKAAVVEHMVETTELGLSLWNTATTNGTVDYRRFVLNTGTWISGSKGNGYLSLGTAPMSASERSQLLYGGERLAYPDEVTRRLVHELGHGALFVAQNLPNMGALHQQAYDVRGRDLHHGLSAIGSLPSYRTQNDKAGEDVAELVAMRTVSEEHLTDYTDFLATPAYSGVRSEVGLTTLRPHESRALNNLVNAALYDALS